jgi:tetratricopeptide (TPR) repeat protein
MAKIGRNDPCPCGSGKKYKRCCLAKGAEAQTQALAAAPVPPAHDHLGFCDDCYAELATASNAVVDLVDAGKLDEAKQAADALLERFPDVHDGYARLGLVSEVRGDHRQAVEYYRKVIAFVREHPDIYDPGFEDSYQELIDRLDPVPGSPTERWPSER